MSVARRNGDVRREALLDAALECFDSRGLANTGIEHIRTAARASPSSVYHLFKGLPDVIAALLERTFVRRYTSVSLRVLKTKTAKSAVETLVEAHLAWVFENRAEAHFMYQALALELDGGHREALRATKDRLKADLSAHLQALLVLPESPLAEGLIDIVLLGVTHQACRAWTSAHHQMDRGWMKRELPRLAWQTARALNG